MSNDSTQSLRATLTHLHNELAKCETMSDRIIVREDIKQIKQQLRDELKTMDRAQQWLSEMKHNPNYVIERIDENAK